MDSYFPSCSIQSQGLSLKILVVASINLLYCEKQFLTPSLEGGVGLFTPSHRAGLSDPLTGGADFFRFFS